MPSYKEAIIKYLATKNVGDRTDATTIAMDTKIPYQSVREYMSSLVTHGYLTRIGWGPYTGKGAPRIHYQIKQLAPVNEQPSLETMITYKLRELGELVSELIASKNKAINELTKENNMIKANHVKFTATISKQLTELSATN